MSKKPRYIIEALFAYLFYGLFKIMPVDYASALGGFIMRNLGPKLGASRTADKNLRYIFPGMNANEREIVIEEMWDNLGRVFAEYPHLKKITARRCNIINEHHMKNWAADDKAGIFFSAHFGNWELFSGISTQLYQKPFGFTYRAMNNPYVENLLKKARKIHPDIEAFPKAPETGRLLIKALREGRSLGFLIDQKFNNGIELDFLGRPAMTNPVTVQLAQKFKVPLFPVQCIRKPGRRVEFDLVIYDPLSLHDKDGTPFEIEKILEQSHQMLEGWIKENPGQWMWVHKRWNLSQSPSES